MSTGFVKPYARLHLKPVPRLVGAGCVPHIPGVFLAFAMNAEEISTGMFLHTLNGSVRWVEDRPMFNFTFELRGQVEDLRSMAHLIRLRQLLTHQDTAILGVASSSMKVARMRPRDQWSIFAEIATEDEPGIVRKFCESILAEEGTLTDFRGSTDNSGKSPGTADFHFDSRIAFADRASALQAINRIEALAFRDILSRPLFGCDPSMPARLIPKLSPRLSTSVRLR